MPDKNIVLLRRLCVRSNYTRRRGIVDSDEIIVNEESGLFKGLFNGRCKIVAEHTNIRAKSATVVNASPEVELDSWLSRQSCAQSWKVSDSLNDVATARRRRQQQRARAARRDVNSLARGSPGSNLGARHGGRHDLPRDLRRNRNWLGRFYSGSRCDITRINARFISSGDNWICECQNGELCITINWNVYREIRLLRMVSRGTEKVEFFYVKIVSF